MSTHTKTHFRTEPHTCVLDSKPGFLLNRALYALFGRARYRPEIKEALRELGRTGTVVYTIKYRGSLEFLLYHFRFRRDRIPYPKIGFDLNMLFWLPLKRVLHVIKTNLRYWIRLRRPPDPYTSGFYTDEIKRGTTSLIVLVDEKGFSERFVKSIDHPLVTVMNAQKEMDRPVYLVPLTFVYELRPEKTTPSFPDIFFGSKENPGTFRKIVLFFRYYRRAFIDVGPEINLMKRMPAHGSPDSLRAMAGDLRDELLDHIDRQRRIILGPPFKSRPQLRELVLDHPEMMQEIRMSAETERKAVSAVRKQAKNHFDEIAANYNPTYVHLWDYVLTFLFKRIFDRVEVDSAGLKRVREAARSGTLVYVPCHRSHLDYLVLNYSLFHESMHTPRIAAGKNLSFWPMGHIFRNSGAFFIRRTFRNQPLYGRVFTRYVQTLLAEGYPIEFFIEGGRSRSGKMIVPKLGLLGITLDTFLSGKCEDLIFAPAHIGYEHIPEEQYYVKEITGKEKKTEGFLQMIKARKFLRSRYGTVTIQFGTPISARNFFAGVPEEVLLDTGQRRPLFQEFSMELIHAIHNVTKVTPFHLIATALVALPRQGFTASELTGAVQHYLDYLIFQEAPLQETLQDPARCTETVLAVLQERNILDCLEDEDLDEEAFYMIEEDKRLLLEYYKNNILHHFVPASLLATVLLAENSASCAFRDLERDLEFLRRTFDLEFLVQDERFSAKSVGNLLGFFEVKGFLEIEQQNGRKQVTLTPTGVRQLPYWSELTCNFLEAYWIVLHSLGVLRNTSLPAKELVRKIKTKGTRLHKLGQVLHPSALSTVSFENALKRLAREGYLTSREESGQPDYALGVDEDVWKNASRRLKRFCHVP